MNNMFKKKWVFLIFAIVFLSSYVAYASTRSEEDLEVKININNYFIGKGPTRLELAYSKSPYFQLQDNEISIIKDLDGRASLDYLKSNVTEKDLKRFKKDISKLNLDKINNQKYFDKDLPTNALIRKVSLRIGENETTFEYDVNLLTNPERSGNQNNIDLVIKFENIIGNALEEMEYSEIQNEKITLYYFKIQSDKSISYPKFPYDLSADIPYLVVDDNENEIQNLLRETEIFDLGPGFDVVIYYSPLM